MPTNRTHDDSTQLHYVTKLPDAYLERHHDYDDPYPQRPSFLTSLRNKLSRTDSRKSKQNKTATQKTAAPRPDSYERHSPSVEQSSHPNRHDSTRTNTRNSKTTRGKVKTSHAQLYNSYLPAEYQMRHANNAATETEPGAMPSYAVPPPCQPGPHSSMRASRATTTTKKKSQTLIHTSFAEDIGQGNTEYTTTMRETEAKSKRSPDKSGKRTGEPRRKSHLMDSLKLAVRPSHSSHLSVHGKSRGSSTGSKPHWWNHKIQPSWETEHAHTPKQVDQTLQDEHWPTERENFSPANHSSRERKNHHKEKSRSTSTSSKPHWWNHKIQGHARYQDQPSQLAESQNFVPPFLDSNQSEQYRVATKASGTTCDQNVTHANAASRLPLKPSVELEACRKGASVSPSNKYDLSQYKFTPVQSKMSSKVFQPRSQSGNAPCVNRTHAVPPCAGLQRKDNTSGIPLHDERDWRHSYPKHPQQQGYLPTAAPLTSTPIQENSYKRENVELRDRLRPSRDISSISPTKDSNWTQLESTLTYKHHKPATFKANVPCNEEITKISYPHSNIQNEESSDFRHRLNRHDVSVPPIGLRDNNKYLPSKRLQVSSSETINAVKETSPYRHRNDQYVDERADNALRDARETLRTPPVTRPRHQQQPLRVSRHSSSGSSVPNRDTSAIRPENTREPPPPSFASRSYVTLESSGSSTFDAKSVRDHAVITKISSHSTFKIKVSKRKNYDQPENATLASRRIPLRSKISQSTVFKNESANKSNSNGHRISKLDQHMTNDLNRKPQQNEKNIHAPPIYNDLQTKYQEKSFLSETFDKDTNQRASESIKSSRPKNVGTSRPLNTNTNYKSTPQQFRKEFSSCKCPDQSKNRDAPTNPLTPSNSFPSNVASTIHSRTSSTVTKKSRRRDSRPTLNTHKKISTLHTSLKVRSNVKTSDEQSKPLTTTPRCNTATCREIFPNDDTNAKPAETKQDKSDDKSCKRTSKPNPSSVCPKEEQRKNISVADLLFMLVFRTHKLQELIKYQLDKIASIEAAVAEKKVDLKYRRKNTKRAISSKMHPEVYDVAASTFKDTKAQLLRELSAIKEDVVKMKKLLSLLKQEDISHISSIDISTIGHEAVDSTRSTTDTKTVVDSSSEASMRNNNFKTKHKINSEVVSKTVTFTGSAQSQTTAVSCRCDNSCSCWRSKTSSSPARHDDVRVSGDDGVDMGDVALLVDMMRSASSHIEECERFVNQIEPTLNEMVSNVKALSHSFLLGRDQPNLCTCDNDNKIRQTKPSTGNKWTPSSQASRTDGVKSHGDVNTCYCPTPRDNASPYNVWEMITTCMQAIIDGDITKRGPEKYSNAEGNENGTSMDEVYPMFEDIDSEKTCDVDCVGREPSKMTSDRFGKQRCAEFYESKNVPDYTSKSKVTRTSNVKSDWTARLESTGASPARASRTPSIDSALKSLMSFGAELAASVRSVESSVLSLTTSIGTSGGGMKRSSEDKFSDDMIKLQRLVGDRPVPEGLHTTRSKVKMTTKSKRKIKLRVRFPSVKRSRGRDKSVSEKARRTTRNKDFYIGKDPAVDSTEFCSCDSLIVQEATAAPTPTNNTADPYSSRRSASVSQQRRGGNGGGAQRPATTTAAATAREGGVRHARDESSYDTCPCCTCSSSSETSTLVMSSTRPPAAPARQNDALCRDRDVATSQMEVYILRRLEPDCLLIEWTVPSAARFSGFDLYVDGVLTQRVRTARRFQALLHDIDLNANHVIALVPLTLSGCARCSAQAQVTYNGGQRPYRNTRYRTCP